MVNCQLASLTRLRPLRLQFDFCENRSARIRHAAGTVRPRSVHRPRRGAMGITTNSQDAQYGRRHNTSGADGIHFSNEQGRILEEDR